MLQVFDVDVAKLDVDVEYVAMVVHVCCKLLFSIFLVYFTHVCCVCVYLNAARVSYICCMCFI
jgi:hypothetical protein